MEGIDQRCKEPNCEGTLDLTSERIEGSIAHLLFRCNKCGKVATQTVIKAPNAPSASAGDTTADKPLAGDERDELRLLRSQRAKGQ
jgi:hypothetical protein